jgi:hypothetical protein
MRSNAGHGYIRLRWKVGTNQYVDAYEHRIVDGRITDAPHVHHRNGQRHDNRPDNLAHVSELDHHAAHARFDIEDAICKFRAGASYTDLAAEYGVDRTSVLRRFQRRGLDRYADRPLRPRKTHCPYGHELTPENVYLNGRHRRCKRCTSLARKAKRATRHEITVPR